LEGDFHLAILRQTFSVVAHACVTRVQNGRRASKMSTDDGEFTTDDGLVRLGGG
jgi:hypothetical protein